MKWTVFRQTANELWFAWQAIFCVIPMHFNVYIVCVCARACLRACVWVCIGDQEFYCSNYAAFMLCPFFSGLNILGMYR